MVMRVRLATLRDLTRITDIVMAGLPDDPTFDYLWRYRHMYPDDNYFFWLQKLKADLFNPRYTFLVVEQLKTGSHDVKEPGGKDCGRKALLDNDGRENVKAPTTAPPFVHVPTVISFAIWERNGSSKYARRRVRAKNTWLNYTQRSLTKLENWAISRQYTRRDGDPIRFNNFLSVHARIHKKYWTLKYPENFHLVLLCTHPAFRCHGAGTKLVNWGKMQAAQEGTIAGVEASPMGMQLYKKLGFELVDTLAVRKEGEEDFLAVPVMVCLSPGHTVVGS